MTTFDEVMAETWAVWSYEGPHNGPHDDQHGTSVCAGGLNDHKCITTALSRDSEDDSELRAHVVVLGKQALALVMKHEWRHVDSDREGEPTGPCWECGEYRVEGHALNCEIGKMCAEARRLRGDT